MLPIQVLWRGEYGIIVLENMDNFFGGPSSSSSGIYFSKEICIVIVIKFVNFQFFIFYKQNLKVVFSFFMLRINLVSVLLHFE